MLNLQPAYAEGFRRRRKLWRDRAVWQAPTCRAVAKGKAEHPMTECVEASALFVCWGALAPASARSEGLRLGMQAATIFSQRASDIDG
jgi:hypothetical protein